MYIRYNNTIKFWEYDTSAAQNGTGPWILLPVDPSKLIGGGAPTGHHATHETGGSDALVTLDGSVIKTGTVVDARLSANIPRLNAANTFTVSNQRINAANAAVILYDTAQPVDNRLFWISNQSGYLYLQATNDAISVSNGYIRTARDGSLFITGNLTERGRGTPAGEWINYIPSWTFYPSGAGVIGNGSLSGRYTLVGKTCFYNIRFVGGSTTSYGPASSYWAFSLPFPIGGDATLTIGSGSIRQSVGGQPLKAGLIPAAFYFGIANAVGIISASTSTSYDTFVHSGWPFTWTINDTLWINGFYEIQ